MGAEAVSMMLARKLPLRGKHYGTKVEIRHGDDSRDITVWFSGGAPSPEQLDRIGVTRQQWDDNALIDDEGYPELAQDMLDLSHYQSEVEAAIADRIAWALNGWSPKL